MEQIMCQISLMMVMVNDDENKRCGFIYNVIYVNKHRTRERVSDEVVDYSVLTPLKRPFWPTKHKNLEFRGINIL